MGISQSEFERIVQEVARERFWDVEISGTDVYLTYHTRKNTCRRYLNYNDGGEITGYCKTPMGIQNNDATPEIFANMVGSRIKRLLNK